MRLLALVALLSCGDNQLDEAKKHDFFTNGPGFTQGGGGASGGLASVTTTARFSGNGTGGSPLELAIAGGTCANGQAATTISATGVATCGNTTDNAYGGTHVEWNTDFMSVPGTAVVVEPYTCSTASGTISTVGAAGRPGIWQLSTSASATGRMTCQTQAQDVDFNSGSWTHESTTCIDTLSSGTDGFSAIWGFFDTAALDQVDGCYFLYDERNAATGGQNAGNTHALECVCAANSVRTVFLINGAGNSNESFALGSAVMAACTLPNTAVHRLKVLMTGTTRAEFFFDGTKVCDINTNIPSGITRATGAGFQILKNVGTTARTIEMDQTRLAVDLTSARSP